MMKPVLLDTHAWVWYALADSQLSSAAKKAADEALAKGILHVATISLWEISMLAKKGRITLGRPCQEWLKDAISIPPMHVVALTPEIAAESAEISQALFDPADSMIMAIARVDGFTLVTRDRKMLDYAKKHVVATVAA